MKKRLLCVVIIIFLIVLTTGCGKKSQTLTCSKRSVMTGGNIYYEKIKMKYSKEKLVSGYYTFTWYYIRKGEAYSEDEAKKTIDKEKDSLCETHRKIFDKSHEQYGFIDTINNCSIKMKARQISKYAYEEKIMITFTFDAEKVNKNKYVDRLWVLDEFERASHFKCEYK